MCFVGVCIIVYKYSSLYLVALYIFISLTAKNDNLRSLCFFFLLSFSRYPFVIFTRGLVFYCYAKPPCNRIHPIYIRLATAGHTRARKLAQSRMDCNFILARRENKFSQKILSRLRQIFLSDIFVIPAFFFF